MVKRYTARGARHYVHGVPRPMPDDEYVLASDYDVLKAERANRLSRIADKGECDCLECAPMVCGCGTEMNSTCPECEPGSRPAPPAGQSDLAQSMDREGYMNMGAGWLYESWQLALKRAIDIEATLEPPAEVWVGLELDGCCLFAAAVFMDHEEAEAWRMEVDRGRIIQRVPVHGAAPKQDAGETCGVDGQKLLTRSNERLFNKAARYLKACKRIHREWRKAAYDSRACEFGDCVPVERLYATRAQVEQVVADAIKTLEIHHKATAGLVAENKRLKVLYQLAVDTLEEECPDRVRPWRHYLRTLLDERGDR